MNERVAIIGGGMTGLALAYYLGRAGWPVTIIEKGPALSGLLGFTTLAGEPIERYYHHFFTHDHHQIELLTELGLADKILWRESRSAVVVNHRLYSSTTKADYLRFPFLSWPAKARAAVAAFQIRRQRPESLPAALTAAAYVRQHFGEENWRVMWQPLFANKFGAAAEAIPAQWIAKRLQIRAGSSQHGREVLGYIHGSYQVFVEALVAAIHGDGGQIMTNTEVTAIPRTAAGTFMIADQEFDQVVSTIAPEMMKKILPELNVPVVSYRAAICPLFTLRSSITPYYWMNVLDPSMPFSVIVNQQALLPEGYYRGRWPLYVGHYLDPDSDLFKKTDAELAEYYLQYLRKVFPNIDQEIVGYEIGRTKYAQPIPRAPWVPPSQTTNIPNLLMTSMAHIYPEDRGVNYAIREAKRLVARLNEAPT